MTTVEPLADILAGLNPPQREAVTHGNGPGLILAGPGSGKTRVITHRIAHLVRERNVAPWRILAVTFTNKAAREMRTRAAAVLGEDAASLAMGTFHSMCARWLRVDGEEIGLASNFVIYDDDDQLGVIKRALEELHVDPKRFTPRSVLSAISAAKNELLGPEQLASRARGYGDEVIVRVFERYQRALRQSNALDFDDLLGETVRLFREDAVREKWAGRYLYVLVDEFQDTNPAQYTIARQLASMHGNITVVGDPDQSIYSWRSADLRNVQYFERDFPGCAVYLLEQNYRSTPAILGSADAVIRKNPGRKDRTLWTDRPGGDLVVTHECSSDEEEGEFVAREVGRLLAAGRRPADIAVLYRTNAQSRAIEEGLVRNRIPYRLIGGVRFYQRREIKDLLAYLRLVHNPQDAASLFRVINVPARGIGQRTIERLRQFASDDGLSAWDALEAVASGLITLDGIAGRSLLALKQFVQLVEALRTRRTGPLPDLLDAVLKHSGYGAALKEEADNTERLDNVIELRNLMSQYVEAGGEGRDLATFLEDAALVADVDELGEGVEAVTLITLHAAKGLEFPVVFMVGMEEGILPHQRSYDSPAQMEEERRLAYVGMTRAMDTLYLTRCYRRFMMGSGASNPESRFLRDLPPKLTRPWGSTRRSYVETVLAPSTVEVEVAAEATGALWQPGDRVRHQKFGVGSVVSTQQNGPDVELIVAFEGAGVRRLLQSYARLTPA